MSAPARACSISSWWSSAARRPATNFGVCPGTQAAGEVSTHVQLHIRIAHQQRLGISVDGNELNSPEAAVDHPVDGVNATTSDPHYLD
jgi:hypothetical protein